MRYTAPKYRTAHFSNFLDENLPEIKQITGEERANFEHIIILVYLNFRSGPLHHNRISGCTSLYAKTLREIFGNGRFEEIRKKVGIIRRVDISTEGSTYGYDLSRKNRELISQFFNPDDIQPAKIINKNGRKMSRDPNSNAIFSKGKTCNGKLSIAKTKAYIPHVIEVNTDAIKDQLTEDVGNLAKYKRKNKLSDKKIASIGELWDLYQMAHNTDYPDRHIPQTYRECSNGRLVPLGKTLLNARREVRKKALSGTGCGEYDFSNCHPEILRQIAAKRGVICESLKDYSDNKDKYREEMANHVFGQEIRSGIVTQEEAEDAVKRVVIAKINGAGDLTWIKKYNEFGPYGKKTDIPKILSINKRLIGTDQAKRLYKHDQYKAIKNDISKARGELLKWADEQTKKVGNVYVNMMGKQISKDEKESTIVSHILMGAEAKMLNIVLEELRGDVLVPRHDGFITRNPLSEEKIQELEEIILEETEKILGDIGIEMKIEKERIYN